METFRFLNFPVYKESKLFFFDCHKLTRAFPREFRDLGDQLHRAALSICLNIAEGSAKYSDKDFHRYLENALGSMNESLSCLDIAMNSKLLSEPEFNRFTDRAENISKQLGGLCKKLRYTR